MAKKQYKITQLQQDNTLLELHPETDANIVNVDNTSGHYGGSATNVQDALEELFDQTDVGYTTMPNTGVFSYVFSDEQIAELQKDIAYLDMVSSGDAHQRFYKAEASSTELHFKELDTSSRTNDGVKSIGGYRITIDLSTKKVTNYSFQNDVGTFYDKTQTDTLLADKQPIFTDGSATIASESNDVVTIKAGISQTGGAIANSSASDITLGTAAKKTATTTVDSNSTDAQVPTAKAVFDAIDAMPEPMIFKGSLGTGGTISDLPAASTANEGYTYKVITAGTYASQAAKVGDTFISDGTNWVLIPSGDEPSGTVTSVGVDTASGSHLSTTGTPVTSSGTITISVDSGYSIPADTDQAAWTAKYDLPATGMPKTDLAQGVQDSLDLADSAYQKPSTGIDTTDLASGVVTSLGKADTAVQSITATGDATGTATVSSGAASIALTLANSGVTAGSYSAVTVDAKGRVTAGGQILEIGTTGQTTPSANLAVGGVFFKEI